MKRILIVLSFLLLLSSCTNSNQLTFQSEIVIEYGETLNPVNWVRTGRFDTIEIKQVDPEKIGIQEIIIEASYEGKVTEYPLSIRIADTKGPQIKELQAFEAPLNSEIQISDYFSADDVRDGLLPVEHSPLDTSKLGSKRVLVWSVDSLKNRTQFEVILNVIDVNPPVISQSKEFLVEKDSTFAIEDFFTFEDEQKDHLDIEIRNSYDLSKVGSYPIVIAASDPSGNTNTYDTVLVVYEEASEELDGYYYIQDADIRDDRYTLVNRRYQLPNNFTPDNLVLFPDNYRIGNASATLETVAAFVEMAESAKKEGISLAVEQGYVNYWDQSYLYNSSVSKYGVETADSMVFRAGHSEHQLGVAIDLCSTKERCSSLFANTNADMWLKKNAAEYGFILRYPRGKEANTGNIYVSYHYRFVGKEVAKHIVSTGLSYEEYYYQFSENLK